MKRIRLVAITVAAVMLMTAGCEEQPFGGSASVPGEDSTSQRRSYPANIRTITGYDLWVELDRFGVAGFDSEYSGRWIRIQDRVGKVEGRAVYLAGWYAGYVELRGLSEEEVAKLNPYDLNNSPFPTPRGRGDVRDRRLFVEQHRVGKVPRLQDHQRMRFERHDMATTPQLAL